MTTKELISALQEMPPDAIIETEGCDCMGDCNKVTFQAKYNKVVLWRSDDDSQYHDEPKKSTQSWATTEEDIELIELEEPKKLSDLE